MNHGWTRMDADAEALSEIRVHPCLSAVQFLVLIALLVSTVALAGDAVPVKVESGWIRAVPPSVTDTAAFMKVKNLGPEPLRLTGA